MAPLWPSSHSIGDHIKCGCWQDTSFFLGRGSKHVKRAKEENGA